MKNLCESDALLWAVVELAAWKWACLRRLPLRSVEPLPAHGHSDCFGWCDKDTKRIAVALRFSKGDFWHARCLPARRILETLAHELAHLKFHSHGKQHRRLTRDLFDDMLMEGVLADLESWRIPKILDSTDRLVVT